MNNVAFSFFHNADSLVFVFNYPFGFCYLAQMLEIDYAQLEAKSEIIFVLSRAIGANRDVDCGEIITPQLDYIEGIKYWTELYLHKSWQAVLKNIVQIQELQIRNFQFEMKLLKIRHNYNADPTQPFSQQFYTLKEKINRIKRATTLLNNIISAPVQG